MTLDEDIMKALKRSKYPLSTPDLSRLTGKPNCHINRKMNTLEKYGLVRMAKVGNFRKRYWSLKR